MYRKLWCTLLFSLPFLAAFSQDSMPFGELTYLDKHFETYEKDPNAPAVVLYEKGDIFFVVKDNTPLLVKKYHVKTKILKEEGFEHANISIPLVGTKESHEDVGDIEAITHNGSLRSRVQRTDMYPTNSPSGIVELKFTFPNVKVGSILEYKYTLVSPFIFKLDGWDFQSSIPKLYSEFNASIPNNYVYNRTLVGDQELCTNQVRYEDCYYAIGNTFIFLCENIQYAMENIPAFNYLEDYSLGASNYISRLDFELSKIKGLRNGTRFTTSWQRVDREFKKDKNIGRQLRYKWFLGRKVPGQLLKEKDEMARALNIYNFIRGHYTWNGGFGIYGEARVKEAFNARKGNVAEINMSLINLLNSAGIKSELVLMSTRQLGLPKKTYPVMSDFNYIIAKAQINGQDYLLDATSKNHPLGILPFRALNHYGRVMDFSEESYWIDIEPYRKNLYQIRARLALDGEEKIAKGNIDILSLGYDAIELKELKEGKSEEEYLNVLRNQFQGNFEIIEYTQYQKESNEKKVSERLKFDLEPLSQNERIYFNPFLIQFFDQNPFLEKERNHPVDFGYPRHYKYQINISIPEDYSVLELPKKEIVKLGDNMAVLKFSNLENDREIMLSFDLEINSTHFMPSDYEVLHQMFDRVMNIQDNTMLVLEKKVS